MRGVRVPCNDDGYGYLRKAVNQITGKDIVIHLKGEQFMRRLYDDKLILRQGQSPDSWHCYDLCILHLTVIFRHVTFTRSFQGKSLDPPAIKFSPRRADAQIQALSDTVTPMGKGANSHSIQYSHSIQ